MTVNIKNEILQVFNDCTSKDDLEYSTDEIKKAFERGIYTVEEKRIRQIYKIFFENFIPANRDDFCNVFKINKRNIKKIYLTSPYVKIEKIAKVWDAFYRIKIKDRIYTQVKQIDENKTEPFIERADDKYEKLTFQPYELTPCIAYELAIRNEEVKKLLDRHNKITEMSKDMKYISNINMSKNLFAFMYGFTNKEEIDQEYTKYQILYKKKQDTYTKLIKNDYKDFIDNHIDKCTELTHFILSDLEKMITNELINEYLIYPISYRRQVPGVERIYEEEITNSKKENDKITIGNKTADDGYTFKSEKVIHDEFIQDQMVSLSGDYVVNHIIPNFHRQINDEQNKIMVPINFSLPLTEITKYIEIIKKKTNPKTPLELLGERLREKSNDLSSMSIIKNEKKVTKNMIRGEKPQYNLINMLYIYDMIKSGFDKDKIKRSILDYYYPENKKEINLTFRLNDNRTIEQYYEIAEEYIEKERYKELITGKV